MHIGKARLDVRQNYFYGSPDAITNRIHPCSPSLELDNTTLHPHQLPQPRRVPWRPHLLPDPPAFRCLRHPQAGKLHRSPAKALVDPVNRCHQP